MNEADPLDEWVSLRVARRHGSAFARRNAEHKAIIERAVMLEWQGSMHRAFSIAFQAVERGPDNAFPDFFVRINEAKLSVELTELLHSEGIVRRAYNAKLTFEETWWTNDHFKARVIEAIKKKADNAYKRGQHIDVLLLHTDEPWLTSARLDEMCSALALEPPSVIRSAYLLKTYCPDVGYWPVHRLFGSVGD
ncbi:hypothetical protein D3C85_718190 [compost metagenome]